MAETTSCSMQRRPNNSSETNINDLPDELLEEILHRLQCVSAVRCKSVTKRWHAIIDNPNFILRVISRQHRLSEKLKHLDHLSFIFSPQNAIFFPKEPPLELEQIVRKFALGFLSQFEVMGESNGWLLCTKHKIFEKSIYYLFNPLTNYCLELPPAPTSKSWRQVVVGFICDPYYQTDSETGNVTFNSQCRFEVVCIPRFSYPFKEFKVEVFSSTIGKWSELVLSSPMGFRFCGIRTRGVAFDGKLFFLGSRKVLVYNPYNIGKGNGVTSLHRIQCDCFYVPDSAHLEVNMGCLGPSCGSLQISQILNKPYDHALSITIWELEDYKKGSWSFLHKIYLNEITQVPREGPSDFISPQQLSRKNLKRSCRMVAFHPYNSDTVYLEYHNRIASCNIWTRTLEVVGSGGYDVYTWRNVFPLALPCWPAPAPAFSQNLL
ncbi:hypothetical protein L6164_013717 [Bauhinia variegata]|uniref:Uncharacterized protein n=1 Tax=Bauhinia variegata TaxID=167791 RepID=A0ACB9NFL0_BAUVA|nr:hypothetical protein L6164_013717 [Bauhinia variegata]